MKTMRNAAALLCALVLASCETPPPPGGAAGFRLSQADLARHDAREAQKAEEHAESLAGQSGTLMYQQNSSGLFGRSSSSGVIRTQGPIQSYQTIGGMPVYPGTTVMPGNVYPTQPAVIQYVRDPRTGQLLPVQVR